MAHFTYTAEKSDGEAYQGSADAADRFALYEIVRREGGRIVTVSEASGGGMGSMEYWNMKLARVGEYDRILFARNLGAMLSAGLPLARALSVMERQTKNLKLKRVLSELGNGVRRGDTLHDALGKSGGVFSSLFVAMVKAGEEGGDLPASFGLIADQMERMYNLKKKIRGALIYPGIIVCAMVGIGIFMMINVVPTLADTFSQMNAQLPESTEIVIGLSNILVHYTWLALGGIIAFVVVVYMIARTSAGKRGSAFLFLHIPVVGNLVREVNAARTARTLSSLIASGVGVLTALQISGEVVQNVYFKRVIDEAAKGVSAGEPLSAAFGKHEDLYPAFVGEMMAVGEETGETADMLKRLALFYEDEVDRRTKDMSTIIEPFLMLLIGGAVGFFAVSMITPIYSLSSVIG